MDKSSPRDGPPSRSRGSSFRGSSFRGSGSSFRGSSSSFRGSGGRGFRGFGRGRGGFFSRGRGGPMSYRGYRGGRGDGAGRGYDRYGSSGYRDSFDRYPPKDYGSSRAGRDYRQRSLTPPPDRDRGMPYYDRDMGPAPRGYNYDRYGSGSDYRGPPGGRDYPSSRDYGNRNRDYGPPIGRYSPDSRDMDSRREYGMRGQRYDSSPPRVAPRRDYDSMPPSRGYGGPRYDSYRGSGGPSRDYDSIRGMSSRNPMASDDYPRGPPRGSSRDGRPRDGDMRRPMPREDDSPPAKRMKVPLPRSSPRGGAQPRRF